MIQENKSSLLWTYVTEKEKTFSEKELQKTNKTGLRVEKVIKRKGDKLYVKWKGYNNSFNSSIDKKDFAI